MRTAVTQRLLNRKQITEIVGFVNVVVNLLERPTRFQSVQQRRMDIYLVIASLSALRLIRTLLMRVLFLKQKVVTFKIAI